MGNRDMVVGLVLVFRLMVLDLVVHRLWDLEGIQEERRESGCLMIGGGITHLCRERRKRCRIVNG
jgi:hypothetical protein